MKEELENVTNITAIVQDVIAVVENISTDSGDRTVI